MRKLLLAAVVTLGLASLAHAVCDSRTTTCLDALEVAGATTIGGVMNTSASTPYAVKFSSKTAAVPTGTPSSTGILAVDNSNILYISTSTNAGGWQKVGAQ